jgi:uncharacterized protein (TIGR04206 family)
MARATARRRVVALLALFLVPWTVFVTGSLLPVGDLVFAWGLVTTTPLHVTTLSDYLFVYTAGLPRRLLAWPVAVLLYGLAVGSALTSTLDGREDPRVIAGLLALAGASHLWFSVGLTQPRFLALPTGTVLLWAAAWWFYWPEIRTGSSR